MLCNVRMARCASPGARDTYVSRLKKKPDSKTELLASLLPSFLEVSCQVEIDASCHPKPMIHWF